MRVSQANAVVTPYYLPVPWHCHQTAVSLTGPGASSSCQQLCPVKYHKIMLGVTAV